MRISTRITDDFEIEMSGVDINVVSPSAVGVHVVVKYSDAGNYEEAIKEWDVVKKDGKVVVGFYPSGIKDAFGNNPHYVFRIINRNTKVELLLGRNDIESHGLLKREEIKEAIVRKNEEVRSYRERLRLSGKYQKYCVFDERETQVLAKLNEERIAIGDEDYPIIEGILEKIENVLRARGYNFEKHRRYGELFRVYEELDRTRFKEFYFTLLEINQLDNIYLKWSLEEEILIKEEAEILDNAYKRLYDLQYALRISAGLWAHDRVDETYRFESCMQAAVAWQANLYIAHLYLERIRSGEIQNAVDLGAGSSPLYVILKELGAHLLGRLIDVEYDKTAYERGRNPLRVRASVADLKTIMDKTYESIELTDGSNDLAVSSFVFAHLSREQRKNAIAEAFRILKINGELIIAMPESFLFGKRILEGIVKLGGEIIGVAAPEPNKLSEEEREKCKSEFGVQVLKIVEGLVSKKFNVLRVRKVRNISAEELAQLDSDVFIFERAKKDRNVSIQTNVENGLRGDYLMALAYAAGGGLQIGRIKVTPSEYIPVEVIETQYPGFGSMYTDLRYLDPILSARDKKRLDEIEGSCNMLRAVEKKDIEWMVGLYKETMKKKIGVGEFVKLFPDHRTWSRKTRMFSGMWIEGIRITDIFSYPEEIRGERFRVQEVLGLIKGSYIKTVDCRTRELLLDPTEEELQGRGISSLKLAELIGIRFNTVYNCLDRKEDERLSKYLLAKVKLRGREIILFDRVKVLEDLEKLKEAFGLGGVRLPPQEGELTGPQLAELIGCGRVTLYSCLKREGDTRLDPYKKDVKRIMSGQDIIVFDEAKVMADLERLKEVFGLGGVRLPPQEGELTGPQLAELIGCDKHTLRSCLKREGDTRLDPYKKDIVRIVKGSETIVFDKEKVMADLAKLRIMFKVKKRIKDEKPEADDDGFSNAA